MIRQCAWCCRVLGEIPPLKDVSVTHGLCRDCHAMLIASPIPGGNRAAAPVRLQDGPGAGMLTEKAKS